MIWFVLKGILLILIFCNSCNPNLEKPNVPISFSFRLDDDFQKKLFLEDIQNLISKNIQDISIEIIVKNDDKNQPILEKIQSIQEILTTLESFNFRIHLIFTKWNEASLKVDDNFLVTWNLKYQSLIQNFIKEIANHKIQSLVYGVDFINIEKCDTLCLNWLKNLSKLPCFL